MDVISQGQQGRAAGAGADDRSTRSARSSECARVFARLREEIIPGLERLADPTAAPADLIALADRQSRSLRAELERPQLEDLFGIDGDDAEQREWVRGHLHDTALQILEFIAGDGFGTGLTTSKIAGLAGGAAHDLLRWIESVDGDRGTQLVPELELVTAQARTLQSPVELVVGACDGPLTSGQVEAIAGAVREAVTNARKHAHATQVVVRVQSDADGRTAVTVTDDGIGIDLELAENSTGLGVKGSIVERMRRVGGEASLEGAPGGGTLVTLRAPGQGG